MPITKFPNGISSFGSIVHGGARPTPGNEFFVRKTTDTGYEAWKRDMKHTVRGGSNAVHTSIVSAIAAAKDYDIIWVYPGEWKETETVAITQNYLKVLAVETGVHGRCFNQTAIYQYDNVDTPCMSIDGAAGVEVAGLWFVPYDPGTLSAGIDVAQTAACRGVYIHHNYFYGVASGATGPCLLRLGTDGGVDCDAAYIYKNDFYCGGASNDSIGQIDWNAATRAQIVENNFWQQGNVADAHCINIYDRVGVRGGIFNNKFMNIEVGLAASDAVAIANPGDTDNGGGVIIDGNQFINYTAAANCIANRKDEILGMNYWNQLVIPSA